MSEFLVIGIVGMVIRFICYTLPSELFSLVQCNLRIRIDRHRSGVVCPMAGLQGKVFVYGGAWAQIEPVQRPIGLIFQRLQLRLALSILRVQISRDSSLLVRGEDRRVIGLLHQRLSVSLFLWLLHWES